MLSLGPSHIFLFKQMNKHQWQHDSKIGLGKKKKTWKDSILNIWVNPKESLFITVWRVREINTLTVGSRESRSRVSKDSFPQEMGGNSWVWHSKQNEPWLRRSSHLGQGSGAKSRFSKRSRQGCCRIRKSALTHRQGPMGHVRPHPHPPLTHQLRGSAGQGDSWRSLMLGSRTLWQSPLPLHLAQTSHLGAHGYIV